MKDYAVTHIRQYLPESHTGSLREKKLSISNQADLRSSDLSKSSDINMVYLGIVRNPSTIRQGLLTSDPETWSDSPTEQPALDDDLRYSYGRFGLERYGNLDLYSGEVIRTTDFSVSSYGHCRTIGFSGEGRINNLEYDSTGELRSYGLEVPSNYSYVYIYDIFSYAIPSMFSYKNPVTTNVFIRLSNFINEIDSSTIKLFLDGEEKEDLVIESFSGGLGGFDITWVNGEEFEYNKQVEVSWTFSDDESNDFNISYWFRTVKDYVGPRIYNITPSDDETDVSVSTCIEFDLRDFEVGVDIDSFELYVNNVLIQSGDLTITELSTNDGYNISYCPAENFLYGDEISVSVYVEDLSEDKNYLFHVYSFITEESNAPIFISSEPVACRKYKPINTDVEVDIVDGGHGIDENTIVLYVDDKEVIFRILPIIYRED